LVIEAYMRLLIWIGLQLVLQTKRAGRTLSPTQLVAL
jgi:hypothetical protein